MKRFTQRSLAATLAIAASVGFGFAPATAAEIGKTLDEIVALAKKELKVCTSGRCSNKRR